MADAVEQAVAELLAAGKQVLTVGGEHSVAVGAARAHARRYPGISFLVVDAHLDLRDQYQGSRLSHACASRRMLELGPLSLVGCRSVAEEELAVLREESRLAVVWAEEVAAARSRDGWIEAALAGLGPEVYVSFDVDGLDPSVIPGTGTPEPGGLGWYDALALLRRLGESRRVVGYDLCELAPIPGSSVSEFAAARLAYKMLGYFEHPRKGMRCPAG
jgi:agmatinase